MGLLVVVIAIELIVSSSILGLSSQPRVLSSTKHQVSSVLGVQQIAQVEDSSSTTDSSNNSSPTTSDQSSSISNTTPTAETITPPESNNTQSADTTTPAPTGTTNSGLTSIPATPEVSPTSSSSDQSNSSDTFLSPSETPGLFDQEINPSSTAASTGASSIPQEQTSPSTNPQFSEEPATSPTPIQTENDTIQTQAVLNPDELINSPDNINNQSVVEAKKEEEQLSQTQDPKEQTKLLVTFATDKVKDMSNFAKSDDFSSTNFAAQRFNSQMDQAISNLDKLPKKDQASLRSQLSNFCNQADQVLRTVELSVPEESEQDIQMARGQCQELKL